MCFINCYELSLFGEGDVSACSESGSFGFYGLVTPTRSQQFKQMVTWMRAVFDDDLGLFAMSVREGRLQQCW